MSRIKECNAAKKRKPIQNKGSRKRHKEQNDKFIDQWIKSLQVANEHGSNSKDSEKPTTSHKAQQRAQERKWN